MQFGTKLKLKKDWQYNQYFLFKKGDEFQIAQYQHKYGMKLHHRRIADLLDFEFNWMTRDTKIEEYFEVVEQFDDKLAELEKVILDYYLAKGYQVGVCGWGFSVQINSDYKDKNIEVFFSDKQNNEKEFDSVVTIMEETTKKCLIKHLNILE